VRRNVSRSILGWRCFAVNYVVLHFDMQNDESHLNKVLLRRETGFLTG
jgi:hypothetical protein